MRRRLLPLLLADIAVLAGLAAGPAAAQYKVVGPDGKVTYTDRPPAAQPGGQVQAMRGGAPTAVAAATRPPLPLELRAAADRFPVTLYTSADCPPCDSGRQLLQTRGIPYTEKTVGSDDDIAALLRLTGARTVPTLMVGGQALRGFLASDWGGTLDLAGYPKESKLPRGWTAGTATPLVARAPVPATPADAARPATGAVAPPAPIGPGERTPGGDPDQPPAVTPPSIRF